MPDYLLTLTLTEPLTLGQRPVISNEIESLEYIPGTTLRGSLASALGLDGRGAELGLWFGTGGPRWSPAYPATDGRGTVVPMPASFVIDKGDGPFGRSFRVFNSLLEPPPKDASDYYAKTGESVAAHRFQWSGVRAKWLHVDNGQPAGIHSVVMDASMHVGLHYGRQANRNEALFSRREIAPGAKFTACVSDPDGVIANWPTEVFLGKRRSAGNGHAAVEWVPGVASSWTGAPLTAQQDQVNVQLISDSIVRDSLGAYYRGLPASLWSNWIGTKCGVEQAASSSRLVMGWSGGSGLARAQALAVTAGSVYRLVNLGDRAAFHCGLMRLQAQGIGERRHEGFGWLCVNPAWLGVTSIAPSPRVRIPSPTAPAEWPGFTPGSRHDLEAAWDDARNVAAHGLEFARKVDKLAAYAARVSEASEVSEYAKSLGGRTHDRGWKEISAELSDLIGKRKSTEEAIFFLNAVVTWLEKEAQRGE